MLGAMERLWIYRLASYGKRGYNMTDGGEGQLGLIHTPESRLKMSIVRKKRIGPASSFYGKSHSDETKAKMSKAKAGRPGSFDGKKHTEESRRKMKLAAIERLAGKPGPFNGRKHTQETKALLSLMMIGNKRRSGSAKS